MNIIVVYVRSEVVNIYTKIQITAQKYCKVKKKNLLEFKNKNLKITYTGLKNVAVRLMLKYIYIYIIFVQTII